MKRPPSKNSQLASEISSVSSDGPPAVPGARDLNLKPEGSQCIVLREDKIKICTRLFGEEGEPWE